MAIQQIPNNGSLTLLTAWQSLLSASFLRLFVTGYNVMPNDTIASLEAVEATFSGYPTGGYPLPTWLSPVFDPLGGAILTSDQILAAYAAPGSGSGVQNNIAGWFLTDASGALIADGQFDNPQPLTANGDGFPISVALLVGNPNTDAQCWVFGSQQ